MDYLIPLIQLNQLYQRTGEHPFQKTIFILYLKECVDFIFLSYGLNWLFTN